MAGAVRNIDEYISACDGDIKTRRITLRALIHSCHPDITEKIAWGDSHLCTEGQSGSFFRRNEAAGFPSGKSSHRCLLRPLWKADSYQKHLTFAV